MRRIDRSRSEAGAILPLFALLLIVLFGFAAFGVDLTAAYAETREAQSTADAAVLAAGLEFLEASSPSNTDLYDRIKEYTVANWGAKAPTDAAWAACQDPDKPADYAPIIDTTATPAAVISDCISIKQVQGEPALLRVRLPDYAMPTAFAKLIGFDTMSISATATAELRYRDESAILPFSVPADAGAEECLATPPSGLLPGDPVPCGGPTQGNFGLLDSPWFGAGDPHFTESQACPNSPQFRTVAPHNIAIGLDHVIRPSPSPPTQGQSSGPPAPVGADTCASAASSVVPYVLQTQTGNSITSNSGNCGSSIFECGFLGDDPSPTAANEPGRLRQTSTPIADLPGGYKASGAVRRLAFGPTSGSFDVDNLGLWEYLLDPTGDQGVCDKSTYRADPSDPNALEGRELTDRLLECLYGGSGPGGVIFDEELVLSSPRFAVVPRLNYNRGSQFGTKWWDVIDLKPVYLHTTWYTCTNGNPNECLFLPDDFDDPVTFPGFDPADRDSYSILFNPGEGSQRPCALNNAGNCATPSSQRWEMQGLSALVLDWDWFPAEARNQFGGSDPFEIFLHPNE